MYCKFIKLEVRKKVVVVVAWEPLQVKSKIEVRNTLSKSGQIKFSNTKQKWFYDKFFPRAWIPQQSVVCNFGESVVNFDPCEGRIVRPIRQ